MYINRYYRYILLGNTKTLWKYFINDLSQQSSIPENPIDKYIIFIFLDILKSVLMML